MALKKMAKIKINNYTRDEKGRFKNKFWKIFPYLSIIVLILLVAYFSQTKVEYVDRVQEKVVTVDNVSEIIAKEKANILDLLEQCESKGDANAINWEDFGQGCNRASFGAYMFKVGTIRHFIKRLTEFQAIELASDRNRSRELASQIIFKTKDGIWNWKNCMIKNNLLEKVNFVKELESKTN